jgi:hypothetical protein
LLPPLLEYMQHIDDPLIYQLIQLVIRSDKVRIKTMHELKDVEQEDPYMPNKCIYYKDSDFNDVLNYIRDFYDSLRKEDEIEETEEDMK